MNSEQQTERETLMAGLAAAIHCQPCMNPAIEGGDCADPVNDLHPEDWCRTCLIRAALAALRAAPAPTIDCPVCGEAVHQVSSATLSLALWLHFSKAHPADPPEYPQHSAVPPSSTWGDLGCALPNKPDCYEYVRRWYGVPAYIGVRVKAQGRDGVLVKARDGQYVDILFDDDKRASGPFHPTDGIEYKPVGAAPAPEGETESRFNVYQGNYFPREIDSTWPTREQAEARVGELDGDWRIEEVVAFTNPASPAPTPDEYDADGIWYCGHCHRPIEKPTTCVACDYPQLSRGRGKDDGRDDPAM